MKYIIHSCDKRLWYVKGFLVPALKEQGIEPIIHNDDDHLGCLKSYIKSFRSLKRTDEGTWHLQDDVMICRDFAKITKEHDDGIVYGFFHRHPKENDLRAGKVPVTEATYSFPCLRIPDKIAVEFTDWFLGDAQYRENYQRWVEAKKYCDAFWKDFLVEKYPEDYVYNLKPSIVEHCDEWMGGSTINKWRESWCHADYWDDHQTIEDLKVKLASR